MKKLSNSIDKFTIYAWPAYAMKKLNPYNYLIYKSIEEQGYLVHDFYYVKLKNILKVVFSKKCKIFHLHWPTSDILKKSNNIAVAWKRIILLFIAIRMVKFLGKKVVWTIHELEDHENYYPKLKKIIDRMLYSSVDGFISMNQKVLETVKEQINSVKKQKVAYIPHPHYKQYYLNNLDKNQAREKLGISTNDFLFLFLGQIRNYKNVPTLVQAFKTLNKGNTVLIIAGNAKPNILRTSIEDLVAGTSNIKLFNAFVSNNDMQVFLNAADLVVTPYKRIYNSGSVFLNLSFSKPTLGPDMYAISELKDVMGPHWIKTYKGELSAAILEKAMQEVIKEADLKQLPNLDAYAPEVIANATLDFYKSLLAKEYQHVRTEGECLAETGENSKVEFKRKRKPQKEGSV